MPEPLSLSKNIGSNTGDNFLRPSNASRPPPPFLRFFLSSRSNRTAPLETLNDPHFCLVISTFVHRKKIYQQRVTTQEKETTRTTPSPPLAPSRTTNKRREKEERRICRRGVGQMFRSTTNFSSAFLENERRYFIVPDVFGTRSQDWPLALGFPLRSSLHGSFDQE